MRISPIARFVGALTCALAWLALISQFALTMQHPLHPALPRARQIGDFFSYFTILTNLLVALTLSVVLHAPDTVLGRRLLRPRVFTGVVVAIVLVGGAYELLLRAIWKPRGFQFLVDMALHDVVPLASVAVWALLIPKGRLAWRDLGLWLIYPGCYLIFALLRGATLGVYPYPFLDVNLLGYARVLGNAAGILAALLGIGAAFIVVDRRAGLSAPPAGTASP